MEDLTMDANEKDAAWFLVFLAFVATFFVAASIALIALFF
jgi:hypothetical protein